MSEQPTSVSPTRASPPSSPRPSLTGEFGAMHLNNEEATSTRDDTFNLYLINEEMRSVSDKQRQLDAAVNKLQATLETIRIGQIQMPTDDETFKVKYKLNLPLNTYEKFIEFDNKIGEDECGTFFELMLLKQYDKEKSITSNIKEILLKYMTNDVIVQFNTKNQLKGKYVLKDTNFSKCLLNVIKKKSPILEENYLKNLKEVLSNIKKKKPASSE